MSARDAPGRDAPSRDDRAPIRPLAILDARLIDPEATDPGKGESKGGVLIIDGVVRELGPQVTAANLPEGADVLRARNACLAPGAVDMRVHACEPGEEHKENIGTAASAALAGGVTTMILLPDTDPPIDDPALIEFFQRRARQLKKVNIHAYGCITSGMEGKELTEIGLLKEAGAVAFTDGTHAVANAMTMRRALSYAKAFGALIVQHPLEPTLARGEMNEGEVATRLGLAGIPNAAETIMLDRDLKLVELTGGRYHAAHISCAESVEIMRAAKKRGLKVTCDTAPFYFTLN